MKLENLDDSPINFDLSEEDLKAIRGGISAEIATDTTDIYPVDSPIAICPDDTIDFPIRIGVIRICPPPPPCWKYKWCVIEIKAPPIDSDLIL
jgi:hypothetical protein